MKSLEYYRDNAAHPMKCVEEYFLNDVKEFADKGLKDSKKKASDNLNAFSYDSNQGHNAAKARDDEMKL